MWIRSAANIQPPERFLVGVDQIDAALQPAPNMIGRKGRCPMTTGLAPGLLVRGRGVPAPLRPGPAATGAGQRGRPLGTPTRPANRGHGPDYRRRHAGRGRLGRWLVSQLARHGITLGKLRADLELTDYTLEGHLVRKCTYGLLGLLLPSVTALVMMSVGVTPPLVAARGRRAGAGGLTLLDPRPLGRPGRRAAPPRAAPGLVVLPRPGRHVAGRWPRNPRVAAHGGPHRAGLGLRAAAIHHRPRPPRR